MKQADRGYQTFVADGSMWTCHPYECNQLQISGEMFRREQASRLDSRQKLSTCSSTDLRSAPGHGCHTALEQWHYEMHAGIQNAGRLPAVWLTLMSPIPLGTTTMPAERVSGSQAARNAHLAVVQFSCGFFTSAPWVDGVPAGVPSDMEADEGATWRNWR